MLTDNCGKNNKDSDVIYKANIGLKGIDFILNTTSRHDIIHMAVLG